MVETGAAEFAALALDAYRARPQGSGVWVRQNFLGDPHNGFFAAAYRTPRSGRLVIAFRGTDFDSGVDWLNNANNTLGLSNALWDSQLNTALQYVRTLRALHPSGSCALCGHSLGGFLATMVGLREQLPAVTFNAAPLGVSGLGARWSALLGRTAPRVVNFRMAGDWVSALRSDEVGRTIALRLSVPELWLRREGLLGDVDPTMHAMARVHEAIVRHPQAQDPPERWR